MRQQQRALPEVAPLRLAEEHGGVASGARRQQRCGPDEYAQESGPAEELAAQPEDQQRTVGIEDPGTPDQPRSWVRLEQHEPEALGALEIEHEQEQRDAQEDEREERRDD